MASLALCCSALLSFSLFRLYAGGSYQLPASYRCCAPYTVLVWSNPGSHLNDASCLWHTGTASLDALRNQGRCHTWICLGWLCVGPPSSLLRCAPKLPSLRTSANKGGNEHT